MVDGGEGGEFGEKALEEGRWKRLYGCGDGGFVREDNVLCDLGVGGKETPVDVGAIADIGVVVLSGGVLEDFLDECLGLGVLRLFEEELDDCCENLELCLVGGGQYGQVQSG